MPDKATPLRAVMEGQGAYNKFAKLPAGGAVLALPLLKKAIQGMQFGDQTIVIADYGSSQGKNSLAPMKVAIEDLRQRMGPNRAISVFHIDQPSNDFNSLFGVLDSDPDRYHLHEPNVFPCAIGRSFYENVLPPESVHLGWCSYAAVWLSRVPALIPGHFFYLRSTGPARSEFERQGAQDWEAFLSLRAKELRPEGRLVVVLPGVADNGLSGFENIMDQANAVLVDMMTAGAITAEERSRMVLSAYPRMKAHLLVPFAVNGHFHNLTVEDFDMPALPDAAWIEYEKDGNAQALATKHARFFRSVFMPSLASGLASDRSADAGAIRTFGDRLENGLQRRLASQPSPMHSFVQVIVLAKRA